MQVVNMGQMKLIVSYIYLQCDILCSAMLTLGLIIYYGFLPMYCAHMGKRIQGTWL